MGVENDSDDDIADLEPTDSRYLEMVDKLIDERLAKKRYVRDNEETD